MIQTFKSESQVYDVLAIQYTGYCEAMCDALEEFTRGRIIFDKDGHVRLPLSNQSEKVRPLNVGDWVIKWDNSMHYWSRTDEEFKKSMKIWGFK